MDNLRYWQKYDVFKLIVIVTLVVLLLVFIFNSEPDSNEVASAPTRAMPELTITATPSDSPAVSNPIPASETPPGPPSTPTPTLTLTASATPTATASPTPTLTATATFTPTPTSTEDTCSLTIESRLAIGQMARVRTELNLRTAPGLDQEIIQVHITGFNLEIIGGPVCIAHLEGAYRWWQVKRPDGVSGWSAEGSLNRFYYFLEPVN